MAAGLGEHLRSGSGIYMARLAETISRVSQGHFPVNLLIVRSLPSMQQVFTTGKTSPYSPIGSKVKELMKIFALTFSTEVYLFQVTHKRGLKMETES